MKQKSNTVECQKTEGGEMTIKFIGVKIISDHNENFPKIRIRVDVEG